MSKQLAIKQNIWHIYVSCDSQPYHHIFNNQEIFNLILDDMNFDDKTNTYSHTNKNIQSLFLQFIKYFPKARKYQKNQKTNNTQADSVSRLFC